MPANIRFTQTTVTATDDASKVTKANTKGKVRVGFIVGPKNCDPILPGTQTKDWPDHLKVFGNTGPNASGWGGMFQVDCAVPLKLKKMHSDTFTVDIIPGSQLTPARLANNHVNFNLGYDLVNAFMTQDKKHEKIAQKAFASPESRLFPEYDLQDFVYRKDRYLRALQKAQVPIIDTIILHDGIKAKDVLKKVKAKGWDRFFIKPAYLCSFGLAGGKFNTKECTEDPSILQNFQDNIPFGYKEFLVQPYTLKPNGNVFDEVRNFFIDGEWAYAVYTDGTDDNGVYHLTKGPYLEATRAVATRAYAELLKLAKWRGKAFVPSMIRVDVGVVPEPTKGRSGLKVFINEFEMEAATWLVRYCPFDIVGRMLEVLPKKALELLTRVEQTRKKNEFFPDDEAMEKLRALVNTRGDTCKVESCKRKEKLRAPVKTHGETCKLESRKHKEKLRVLVKTRGETCKVESRKRKAETSEACTKKRRATVGGA